MNPKHSSLFGAKLFLKDEAVKLANYLVSRRGVQMDRGAYLLVKALKKLAFNNFQVPVVISLASNMAIMDASQVRFVSNSTRSMFTAAVSWLQVNGINGAFSHVRLVLHLSLYNLLA